MSCNNYNSNGAPQVTLSGSVPGGSCFTTVSDLFDLFKNSLVGSLPSDFTTFLISDTEPSPSNRDKAWIYVDSATCRPIGLRLYLNGAWVDVGARYFYGTDTSSVVNTITVASTTPSVNWSEAGQLFAIKIAQANTGPVTISITNGTTTFYSGVAIKQYGSSDLSGLELLAGQVALFFYDGTQFQLLNPRPSTSGGSTSTGVGFNLSFEDDTDGNGVPDSWGVYARGGSATGVSFTGSGGTDSYSSPTGGTFTLDTATTQHGSKSAKFTCTSGAGNGGGAIQNSGWIPCDANSIVELSWWARTSASGIDCSAEILWYSDKSDTSAYLSKTTLWTDTANGPNSYWYQLGGIAKAPSTARYYKIRLIAGILNNDVSGSVWFDDVQLNAPRFNKKIQFTASTFNVTSFIGASYWLPVGNTIQAKVTCVGGGGSGYTTSTGGGGGGGGGAISYVAVTPSTRYDVKIPQRENNASFNLTTVVGNAGSPGTSGAGGSGGTGGTGDVTFAGENGGAPGTGTAHGGSSIMGAGGSSVDGQDAQGGQLYGGGAAGRSTASGSTASVGAQGIVVIEYN